jgi:quercetin dioxygenase-like cupin family protein
MGTAIPIVRADGEGEQLWFFGGGTHIWKATAEETDGAFLLFEDHLTQGKTTPLHRHPDAAETLYVLEGEIVVNIDGAEHRMGPGGMTMAPRGTPHAFLVTSESARLLTMQTPGGTQSFFRHASEPVTPGSESSGTVDLGRVRASAEQHGGVEILGPPPFAPE